MTLQQNLLKNENYLIKIKKIDKIDMTLAKQKPVFIVELDNEWLTDIKEGFYKEHPSLFIDGDGKAFWNEYNNNSYYNVIAYYFIDEFLFYFCQPDKDFGSKITGIYLIKK